MVCWHIHQQKRSTIIPLTATSSTTSTTSTTSKQTKICAKFVQHTTNELQCKTCNHCIVDHACCEKFTVNANHDIMCNNCGLPYFVHK